MTKDSPIYVTQPYLPPLAEFIPLIEEIWESRMLTNGGPFHSMLENRLCDYLDVPYVSLFANGTLALVAAMSLLEIKGEVITTPYTFAATSHSLIWLNVTPVFVDIESDTGNIDPSAIEDAITNKTSAILGVHCYGNPCNTAAIEKIAEEHSLKVVYDAAHAFGVKINGRSILLDGDMSAVSFHATKVFNTFEGGAVICHDSATKTKLDQWKNFGFVDEVTVESVGVNAKMSELNAAVGVLQLKHIDEVIRRRLEITERYLSEIDHIHGIEPFTAQNSICSNGSYFPVRVTSDFAVSRDELYGYLKQHGIHTRRYFYPLITQMAAYTKRTDWRKCSLQEAEKLALEILCLPIYPELPLEAVSRCVTVMKNASAGNILCGSL